jgi:sensor histidine kinase YesM
MSDPYHSVLLIPCCRAPHFPFIRQIRHPLFVIISFISSDSKFNSLYLSLPRLQWLDRLRNMRLVSFIFYFLFLQSGLVHLLPPLLSSYLSPEIIYFISSLPSLSWEYAVYALCIGHFFHCLSSYHLSRTLII